MRRLAIVLAALVVAGCAASRPATRYDVWAWSVAIPDDLRVSPSNADDPADIWRNGPLLITGDADPNRFVHVRVQPLKDANLVGDTAVEILEAVAAEADSEEIGPVEARRFPVGDGAFVHAVRLGLDLDIIYIVARDQLITVTGSELAPADILFIADSFAFRDPPGDPSGPPPSGS